MHILQACAQLEQDLARAEAQVADTGERLALLEEEYWAAKRRALDVEVSVEPAYRRTQDLVRT